jgi:hypothetical protein
MTVNDVCDEIENSIELLNDQYKQVYKTAVKENNINGKVLACCNLQDLKAELKMTFGDWELFKNWVQNQRIIQAQITNNNSNLTRVKNITSEKNNFYKLKSQGEYLDQKQVQPKELLAQQKQNSATNAITAVPTATTPNDQKLTNTDNESITKSSNNFETQRSQTSRKVEFFITPVIENVPISTVRTELKSCITKGSSPPLDDQDITNKGYGIWSNISLATSNNDESSSSTAFLINKKDHIDNRHFASSNSIQKMDTSN